MKGAKANTRRCVQSGVDIDCAGRFIVIVVVIVVVNGNYVRLFVLSAWLIGLH
jgi:hypothetical protein